MAQKGLNTNGIWFTKPSFSKITPSLFKNKKGFLAVFCFGELIKAIYIEESRCA